MATTRAGNIFTTHTPVPAGFDRFPSALMDLFLRRYAEDRLGIALDALLALARENPNDPGEPFNMAYLAVSGSAASRRTASCGSGHVRGAGIERPRERMRHAISFGHPRPVGACWSCDGRTNRTSAGWLVR
jgi:hypothetical protein